MKAIRVLSIVAILGSALPAHAVPLTGTWTTQYRSDIAVYLCTTTFSNQFPSWDQNVLRDNVKVALDTWNVYGNADFRLRYAGDRTSTTSGGCAASQAAPNGEITIKAELFRPGATAANPAATSWGGGITRATISFYKNDQNGNAFTWTFDNQAAGIITFVSVLIHEMGHALGFPDIYTTSPRTVMYGITDAANRVLWHEDIVRLRDSAQTNYYNNVTTRQIRHTVSTNNGVSWAAEGNLQEFTNSRIAVAFNAAAASNRRYIVAWRGTNGNTYVNTIMGNGASYDSSSKVTLALPTDYGPAVAFGGGKYVEAYVTTSDTRRISFVTSTDGVSWVGPSNVTYNGSTSYGSMWEPELAYNPIAGVFILSWTNWLPGQNDDALGRMRFCTSPNPATTPFANCIETANAVLTTPAVTCHESANECLVTWQNHVGSAGHQICYRLASVSSGVFGFTGTTQCFTNDGSRLPTALTEGNGYYVLGWRGSDANNTGNTLRQTTWPNWLNTAFPDSPLQVGPELAYGSSWTEFAFYYVRR